MYSYMADKDYFNHYYKRTLANRLLRDTTVGADQENQFLTMIRQRCGATYTTHQEGMINDIRESETRHAQKFEVNTRTVNMHVGPKYLPEHAILSGELVRVYVQEHRKGDTACAHFQVNERKMCRL